MNKITAADAFAALNAVCATVTPGEVLAALRATEPRTPWGFTTLAPVGAEVVSTPPGPDGSFMTVAGVVVAHRPDPVAGYDGSVRTLAVVVDRFGRLRAARVTGRPARAPHHPARMFDRAAALAALGAE